MAICQDGLPRVVVWAPPAKPPYATLHDKRRRRVLEAKFSADGARVYDGWRVWDVRTGSQSDGPVPELDEARNRDIDGHLMVLPGDRVLFADPRATAEEVDRRAWLTRPDPEWHVEGRKKFERHEHGYAAALHHSFEHRARGVVAAHYFDFDKATGHFLAAELLKPKPPVLRPAAPGLEM